NSRAVAIPTTVTTAIAITTAIAVTIAKAVGIEGTCGRHVGCRYALRPVTRPEKQVVANLVVKRFGKQCRGESKLAAFLHRSAVIDRRSGCDSNDSLALVDLHL